MPHLMPILAFIADATNSLDNGHASRIPALIFRLVVLLVFIAMQLLYFLYWRNGKSDYVQSLSKAEQKILAQPEKEEFALQPVHPHTCHCGYDLTNTIDRWIPTDDPLRCPECGREVVNGWCETPLPSPPAEVKAARPAGLPAVVSEPQPAPLEVDQFVVEDAPAEEEILEAQPDDIPDELAPANEIPAEEISNPVETIGVLV